MGPNSEEKLVNIAESPRRPTRVFNGSPQIREESLASWLTCWQIEHLRGIGPNDSKAGRRYREDPWGRTIEIDQSQAQPTLVSKNLGHSETPDLFCYVPLRRQLGSVSGAVRTGHLPRAIILNWNRNNLKNS